MTISLYQIDATLQSALDTLSDNGGVLTPELESILTLDSEQWADKVKGYLHVIANLEAQAEACKAEAARITAAKKRAESQVDVLKARLAQSLKLRGGEPATVGTWKLSLRTSEAVEVAVDASALPTEYQTVKVEPNKAALKAAIKAGTYVDGVAIVKRDNLQIK